MDDKRIEQLLRDSWSPEPPDTMRERVLARARQQTAQRRAPFFGLRRWQAALVAASLLLVLSAGLSDHARQVRLASVRGGTVSRETQVAACPQTLGRLYLEMNRMLEHPSSALPQ